MVQISKNKPVEMDELFKQMSDPSFNKLIYMEPRVQPGISEFFASSGAVLHDKPSTLIKWAVCKPEMYEVKLQNAFLLSKEIVIWAEEIVKNGDYDHEVIEKNLDHISNSIVRHTNSFQTQQIQSCFNSAIKALDKAKNAAADRIQQKKISKFETTAPAGKAAVDTIQFLKDFAKTPRLNGWLGGGYNKHVTVIEPEIGKFEVYAEDKPKKSWNPFKRKKPANSPEAKIATVNKLAQLLQAKSEVLEILKLDMNAIRLNLEHMRSKITKNTRGAVTDRINKNFQESFDLLKGIKVKIDRNYSPSLMARIGFMGTLGMATGAYSAYQLQGATGPLNGALVGLVAGIATREIGRVFGINQAIADKTTKAKEYTLDKLEIGANFAGKATLFGAAAGLAGAMYFNQSLAIPGKQSLAITGAAILATAATAVALREFSSRMGYTQAATDKISEGIKKTEKTVKKFKNTVTAKKRNFEKTISSGTRKLTSRVGKAGALGGLSAGFVYGMPYALPGMLAAIAVRELYNRSNVAATVREFMSVPSTTKVAAPIPTGSRIEELD